MSPSLRTVVIILLLISSWSLLLVSLFFVATGNSGLIPFLITLVPTLLLAVITVILAQKQSQNFFFGSIASLVLSVLFLVSPFIKALSPVSSSATKIVTSISLAVTGKTPYEWGNPLKTPEEWLARAWHVPLGLRLNFNTFPNIPSWTRVCIFPGHSTDAEFISAVNIKLPWKLSDKSKSTTHKDHTAIAFVDDKSQNVVMIYDIPRTKLEFDKSVKMICLTPGKAFLNRQKEPGDGAGPTFTRAR